MHNKMYFPLGNSKLQMTFYQESDSEPVIFFRNICSRRMQNRFKEDETQPTTLSISLLKLTYLSNV